MSELAFETFGNILSEDVIKKLIGEHKSTERIMDCSLPSKKIVVGNLACLSNKDERLSNRLEDKYKEQNIYYLTIMEEIQETVTLTKEDVAEAK